LLPTMMMMPSRSGPCYLNSPQMAPIDEGLTPQCLQIVDLGFHGIRGASRTRRWSDEQRRLTREKWWFRVYNDRTCLSPLGSPIYKRWNRGFPCLTSIQTSSRTGPLHILLQDFLYWLYFLITSSSSWASKPLDPQAFNSLNT
jgi:hypothetical protein